MSLNHNHPLARVHVAYRAYFEEITRRLQLRNIDCDYCSASVNLPASIEVVYHSVPRDLTLRTLAGDSEFLVEFTDPIADMAGKGDFAYWALTRIEGLENWHLVCLHLTYPQLCGEENDGFLYVHTYDLGIAPQASMVARLIRKFDCGPDSVMLLGDLDGFCNPLYREMQTALAKTVAHHLKGFLSHYKLNFSTEDGTTALTGDGSEFGTRLHEVLAAA